MPTLSRKEADEFDRGYTREYGGDMSTFFMFVSRLVSAPALINRPRGTQAGLLSTVNPAFIIDIQSKLGPDPNEMTAVCTQVP